MGTSIRKLSQYSELVESDQIPINSLDAGGDVRVALSVLAAFIQTLLTVPTEFQHQYSAPSASGFSVTVDPAEDGDNVYLILRPAAGYAAGTIVLPAGIDGQEVLVKCSQAVTTLTMSTVDGRAINGDPTTLAADAYFRMRFDGVALCWDRVG